MFIQRLISGIVLLIIMIGAIVIGDNVLLGLMAIVTFIGLYEFYRASGIKKTIMAYLGYAATAGFYILLLQNYGEKQMMMLLLAYFLVLMILYVITYPKYVADKISLSFFGFFYVTIMLSYIYQVRMLENGILMVWLIFISAWGSDTCAYCVGMLFGKHKLPNKLSPKKTIEGCIGGIVGAALIGVIYATVFQAELTQIQSVQLAFGIIGAVGSVLSQFGDLAASAIKRNYGIKDYGKLIPGHGGILDRFDSIIVTAPVVFLLLQLFIK